MEKDQAAEDILAAGEPHVPKWEEVAPVIKEPMIGIGRTSQGLVVVQTLMNPAAAVVLLEQMKLSFVQQFQFNRERKIVTATDLPVRSH